MLKYKSSDIIVIMAENSKFDKTKFEMFMKCNSDKTRYI